MKYLALLIVVLLVISQHLVYSASIKASIYNATLTYGSFDCDRFANLFSGNGQFSTPRGTFNGPQAVVTECKRMKSKIAGSGAYPHDMYVTSSSAAFFFHIRALSVDDCHIDWPGIVEIEYDQYGKISNFNHQYDDDWMDASYACKQSAGESAARVINRDWNKKLNAVSQIKTNIYTAALSFTSDPVSFSKLFKANGKFSSPVDPSNPESIAVGPSAIAYYLSSTLLDKYIMGAGAYVHDMYINNAGTSGSFKFHVRAISKQGCQCEEGYSDLYCSRSMQTRTGTYSSETSVRNVMVLCT